MINTSEAVALLETKRSLDLAITKAGGDPEIAVSVEALQDITAMDFLCKIAPNGIRFCVKDPT